MLLQYHTDFKDNLSLNDIILIESFLHCIKKKHFDTFITYTQIEHSISISSPPYEKLSYTQVNIFVDPFHERLLKHSKSVNLHTKHINIPKQSNTSIAKFNIHLNDKLEHIKQFYGIQNHSSTTSDHSSLIMNYNINTPLSKSIPFQNDNSNSNNKNNKT